MRYIILVTLILVGTLPAFSQVGSSFGGSLNIYSSSNSGTGYSVQGFFNDPTGRYASTDCQVGDVIFISAGDRSARLVIDSIISNTGSVVSAVVSDPGGLLSAPPSGIGAVMRETLLNNYPIYASGISETLQSQIQTHFSTQVDTASGGEDWLGTRLAAGDVDIFIDSSALRTQLLGTQFFSRDLSYVFSLADDAEMGASDRSNTVRVRQAENRVDILGGSRVDIGAGANTDAMQVFPDSLKATETFLLDRENIAPAFAPGGLYYNTAEKLAEWSDGTSWYNFEKPLSTLTVCNNADTCDFSTVEDAMAFAMVNRPDYDASSNQSLVEIVMRPNPDGSPIIWNGDGTTLNIGPGNYGGIAISSRWQDSTYQVELPSGSSGALVSANRANNLTFENLHVTNNTGAGQQGFRIIDCMGVVYSRVRLDTFGNAFNLFRGTHNVNSCILNNGTKGVWNQNGVVNVVGGLLYENGTGIDNRGMMVARFGPQTYNNTTNVNNSGFFTTSSTMFTLDTLSSNTHVLSDDGGVASFVPTENIDQSNVLHKLNAVTKDGLIFYPGETYDFEPLAADPSVRENGYYYNTVDSLPKWSDGSQWLPLPGLPGLLPLDTVDIDASQNRLRITNTSNLFFTSTDGVANTQTFQMAPTSQKVTLRSFDVNQGSRSEVGLEENRMQHSGPNGETFIKMREDSLFIDAGAVGRPGQTLVLQDSVSGYTRWAGGASTIKVQDGADFSATNLTNTDFKEWYVTAVLTSAGATSDCQILLPTPSALYVGTKLHVSARDENSTHAITIANGNTWANGTSYDAVTPYEITDEVTIYCALDPASTGYVWIVED